MGLGSGIRPTPPKASSPRIIKKGGSSFIDKIDNWLIDHTDNEDDAKAYMKNMLPENFVSTPSPLEEYKGRFAYQDDEDLMNEIDTLLGLRFEVPAYTEESTLKLMIESRMKELEIDYNLYKLGKEIEEMKKK